MLGVGKGVASYARMVLTYLLTVTRAGVRPFFNNDTSASLRVLDDKLITQSTFVI